MITVDFGKTTGKMKPMHGLNCGPLQSYDFSYDVRDKFREAGIPFSRLHDIEYPHGGGLFVDIHCVFPDFSADENDPASYDFDFTDKYIAAIIEVGAQVFYRLGESIDHGHRKKYVRPPEDVHKWARICEHIVAHYNEGWSDGFRYGIAYWELWNEPENAPMWTGTPEEYFELYTVTANHLKNRFGDTIKVGGYASCGFHALESEFDDGGIFTRCMKFFHDFLAYIESGQGKAPLDFFSFHIYTGYIRRIQQHTLYCRRALDEHGFKSTELTLNEWNRSGNYYENTNANAAAFYAAFMCAAQALPLDSCMFYGSGHGYAYNNLFDNIDARPLKPYYAFSAFNKLYELGDCVEYTCTDDGVYICAATDGRTKRLLICNPDEDRRIRMKLTDVTGKLTKQVVDCRLNLESCGEINAADGYVDVGKNSAVLLEI